jgi:hypothetical protein
MRRSALAFFAFVASAQYTFAGDVSGVWLHEDGGSKVRFTQCGAAVLAPSPGSGTKAGRERSANWFSTT